MAISKITWENKEGIQNDESIARKNKVMDDDMNEIKQVVNNNANELSTAQSNIENLQSGQGTANTDITNLKSRVSALETDNTTNKSNIQQLQNNQQETETNVETLQEKVTTLETDNTQNKSDINALKTDNETNKSNISTLQEEQLTQNANIENLQEKDTTQDELIEKLQQENKNIKSALINVETEQAKSLHIEDASTVSAQLSVEGNAEQEVTETENNVFNGNLEVGLWDYNTGEKTTAVNAVRSVDYIDVEGLSQISIVAQNEINFTDIGVRYYSANKEYIGRTSINDITNAVSTTINNNLDDTKTVKYMTFNLVGTTDTNTKIAINKNVDLEWHDFIPNSPSPNYPSKIKCLGSNKNLFSENYYEFFSGNQSATKEIINNKDKEIKVTTTANAYSGIFLNTTSEAMQELIEQINGKTVTYSFEAKADTNINLQIGKSSNAKIVNLNNEWQKFDITYENTNTCSIYFYNNSATVTNFYVRKIKLEEGEVATSYSPYRTR